MMACDHKTGQAIVIDASVLSPFEDEEMPSSVNPVNWFEIPVTDLARAGAFYSQAFGYEITEVEMGPTKMGWFPMEYGASGATGTLVLADGFTPSKEGSLVYFSVKDLDATLTSIEAAGGAILLPKTDIGEHGCFAHFEDSEGNRIGVHQAAEGEA
ncbi:VOC family protein [Calycomorphotria hydatis]|uniref:Glyoxalase-like domain protein n=1 Tax=Calycomorphotria hydatis TaxID=2528027 RepID=A0A517T4C8_9PLAN|nr:VOC family protein [Calycomorphotria hydatis]QDT63230.1 Glyoxalase-like domain protein [Calycomorphotria hydatis]